MSDHIPANWIDVMLSVMATDDFERCCGIHTISKYEIDLVIRQMRRRIPIHHIRYGTMHLTEAQLREIRITELRYAARSLRDGGQYMQYGIPNSHQ